MRNSCGGFEVEITSCLTVPGSERQVKGVDVGVIVDVGMGLGVDVNATVGVDGITVWVGKLPFVGEQAESPARSEREVMKRIA